MEQNEGSLQYRYHIVMISLCLEHRDTHISLTQTTQVVGSRLTIKAMKPLIHLILHQFLENFDGESGNSTGNHLEIDIPMIFQWYWDTKRNQGKPCIRDMEGVHGVEISPGKWIIWNIYGMEYVDEMSKNVENLSADRNIPYFHGLQSKTDCGHHVEDQFLEQSGQFHCVKPSLPPWWRPWKKGKFLDPKTDVRMYMVPYMVSTSNWDSRKWPFNKVLIFRVYRTEMSTMPWRCLACSQTPSPCLRTRPWSHF